MYIRSVAMRNSANVDRGKKLLYSSDKQCSHILCLFHCAFDTVKSAHFYGKLIIFRHKNHCGSDAENRVKSTQKERKER